MEDDSSSCDDRSSQDVDIDLDDMMQDGDPTNAEQADERAYWMQRTVREAIYGRVLFATVLRKRPRDPLVDPSQHADWEVTEEQCAIKEMSWQHIRKERNKLAEDPIKEVSAMQYFKNWHQSSRGQSLKETATHSSSFVAVMETNVMMPLDLLSDDRHLYSVMPYCSGGELFERLDLNERFQEEEARFWMHQILNVSCRCRKLQSKSLCSPAIFLPKNRGWRTFNMSVFAIVT
jgi:serine/threonine protein kinase